MAAGVRIKKNQYFDSVFLMQVSQRLSEEPGVEQAVALMGTEKNRALLADLGFGSPDIRSAEANDLVVVLSGASADDVQAVLDNLDHWLLRKPAQVSKSTVRTLGEALNRQPDTNLAVISIPGDYAAAEARKALERGLNVFLFSDNVSVEDELALKQYAQDRGLIVMGPDCGTAIMGGIGLGFANVVRRGPIGVIGASGTGLQEFTSLVHQRGSGISHAIGTGGRDLTDAIGGITTFRALEALEADPQTAVIVLLSKPPGPMTLTRLVERLNQCAKPVLACFLGIRQYPFAQESLRFTTARTLDDAVKGAVQAVYGITVDDPPIDIQALSARERALMQPGQKYVRGLFAGGTFCYQAQQVLRDGGLIVHSNAPLDGMIRLGDPSRSVEHTLIDLGADEFTVGRPHPMIDASLRRARILEEAHDPQTAVLLLDFVLGYNASPNPVGDLLESIRTARDMVSRRGGYLSVVASVCGTDRDVQDIQAQTAALNGAGIIVMPSSAQAAHLSRELALSIEKMP
jgi:succinyl-CoA synthetase alpha subunit